MDANRNDQAVRQFTSLYRGEKHLEEYIRWGNADPNTIVPPLKSEQEPLSLGEIRAPSGLGVTEATWPPQPSPSRQPLSIENGSLQLCSPGTNVKYISTNDAVSTFLLIRTAAAHSAHLPKDSNTALLRAVNGRRTPDAPIYEGYMGHAVMSC